MLSCEIYRPSEGSVTLGETRAEPGSAPYKLEPVYKVWGKYMPQFERQYFRGPDGKTQTLIERLDELHREEFERSRLFLVENGEHPVAATILWSGSPVTTMRATGRQDLEDADKHIASEMALRKADGVVVVCDGWLGTEDDEGNFSPTETASKVLISTVLYRGVSPSSLMATISNEDGVITVSEAEPLEGDRWAFGQIKRYLAGP